MFHALHCWAIAQNVPLTYYYQSGYMLSNFRQRCTISYYAVQLHEGCLTPSCKWSLVIIKPTESEAEHCFHLWLRSLTIKWKLHYRSCKQKRKNQPITMFDSAGPGDWLVLPLLSASDSDNLVFTGSQLKEPYKRNRQEEMKTFWFFRLRFRRAYGSAYDSDFWFSLGHKLSYDSDYDSNSDSVAS